MASGGCTARSRLVKATFAATTLTTDSTVSERIATEPVIRYAAYLHARMPRLAATDIAAARTLGVRSTVSLVNTCFIVVSLSHGPSDQEPGEPGTGNRVLVTSFYVNSSLDALRGQTIQ